MSGYVVDVDLTLTLRVNVAIAIGRVPSLPLETVEDAIDEAVARVMRSTEHIGKREVGFPVLGRYAHATDAVEEGTA